MNLALRSLFRGSAHRPGFSTLAKAVLMVRPVDFTYNPQTAKDNEFMKKADSATMKSVIKEYEQSVESLHKLGVQVVEFDKSKYPEYEAIKVPDAVFPNNWFSTTDKDIWLYRMKNPSRSLQKLAICQILPILYKQGFQVNQVRSWNQSVIEGTGVLLFDRKFKKIYINKSQRADGKLEEFCHQLGYTPVIFESSSKAGSPFYHTNVILSIGDDYVVVSSYSIDNANRKKVVESLSKDRVVIDVDADQTEKSFCANVLQVQGSDGPVLVMSKRAYDGFTKQQRDKLAKKSKFAIFPLDVIETVGGGSARCMVAEIFLKKSK